MKHLALLTVVLMTGCAGSFDMGALVDRLPGHLDCTLSCASCIQALHQDGADDAPAAVHVACAAHCAGCTAAMVEDVAEVAGQGDVEPAPLPGGAVCPIDP